MKRSTMSGSLYRLIYCSRNVITQVLPAITTQEGLRQEILTILATARRRNKEDNITGALLFTASGFAHVLEGPREVLERTFDRINDDPRHADVTALSFTPTERRSFPDWSMGFCGQMATGTADLLATLLADTTLSGPRVTRGSDVLRMMEHVVQREDEWIAA
jgi:hypothetical protein